MIIRRVNKVENSRENELLFGVELEGIGRVTSSPVVREGLRYCNTYESLNPFMAKHDTLESYAEELEVGEIGKFHNQYFIVDGSE